MTLNNKFLMSFFLYNQKLFFIIHIARSTPHIEML
jgi:hypothetical protein